MKGVAREWVQWTGPYIHWWSFDFERMPVPAFSSKGTPYVRQVRCGMPQIPEGALKSTFHLYASKDDAENGSDSGGTGFLVAVPSETLDGVIYPYAVTNWHVAVRDGFSVIRLNLVGGGIDIFEADPADWIFTPGSHDIAALQIAIKQGKHDCNPIHTGAFLTREMVGQRNIGPGEDIFMVGRFIDHDGVDSNLPSVRFGNISVMPKLPIRQPTRASLESYILDVHSRSGYSGSPVFVYRTPGGNLNRLGRVEFSENEHFLSLLGIHWGQFPELWEITEKEENRLSSSTLETQGKYIQGWSGMTLATPSWAIVELLNVSTFRKARKQADLSSGSRTVEPKAESASDPQTTDENPIEG